MPSRWNTLRIAGIGALIGAVFAVSMGGGAAINMPMHLAAADLVGQSIGGAAAGAAIGAAVSGLRNWFA